MPICLTILVPLVIKEIYACVNRFDGEEEEDGWGRDEAKHSVKVTLTDRDDRECVVVRDK